MNDQTQRLFTNTSSSARRVVLNGIPVAFYPEPCAVHHFLLMIWLKGLRVCLLSLKRIQLWGSDYNYRKRRARKAAMDINWFEQWAETSKRKFNKKKYRVLFLGRKQRGKIGWKRSGWLPLHTKRYLCFIGSSVEHEPTWCSYLKWQMLFWNVFMGTRKIQSMGSSGFPLFCFGEAPCGILSPAPGIERPGSFREGLPRRLGDHKSNLMKSNWRTVYVYPAQEETEISSDI